jgi:hypothetical protein
MTNDDYQYNYDAIEQSRIYAIVIGFFSTIFPLSVVFILLYRYEKLVQGRSFIQYVLVIALCDTITSITIAIGYPNDKLTCAFQGFISIFFGRASCFFTNVLVAQLFYIIVYRKYFLTVFHMHCLVWVLNIILQMIPYITDSYYGPVYHPNQLSGVPIERCYIGSEVGLKLDSYLINLPIVLSFGLVGLFSIGVFAYSWYIIKTNPGNVILVNHIRDSQSTVILYPLAMLVSYTPGTYYYYYHY